MRLSAIIGCEFSGKIREEMRKLGHNAYSCDILPAEDGSPYHIQGDAIEAVRRGLDGEPWCLGIFHPPCQFLANSGVRWLYQDNQRNEPRWAAMRQGAKFFADLWTACEDSGVKAWAFENPVMHGHAAMEINRLNPRIPMGKQIAFFQPWEHGHPETKRTGLYLHGLPSLKPSNVVFLEMKNMARGQSNRVHFASPGPDRWKERSRTLPGVAKAMAAQFSAHLIQNT